MRKRLKVQLEYSSISHDPKWLVGIEIHNFSSRRTRDNEEFIKELKLLIGLYNYGSNS